MFQNFRRTLVPITKIVIFQKLYQSIDRWKIQHIFPIKTGIATEKQPKSTNKNFQANMLLRQTTELDHSTDR